MPGTWTTGHFGGMEVLTIFLRVDGILRAILRVRQRCWHLVVRPHPDITEAFGEYSLFGAAAAASASAAAAAAAVDAFQFPTAVRQWDVV